MTFKIKSELPKSTQREIDRVVAIDESQRLQTEKDFLTALEPYLHNEIIARDASGLITQAAGEELPEGDAGFRKHATFMLEGKKFGLYKNSGDSEKAKWTPLERSK